MKSWKEENLLNEGFGVNKTPSGYRPTIGDRNTMKMNARDLGNMLVELANIAGGKSSRDFDEAKQEFEEVLAMYYSMLDDIRR